MNYFAKRIIPCLDVDNGRVVKGVNFVGLKDAGDPVEVAKRYNKEGADEITFLDIGASHEGRDTIVDVVKNGSRYELRGLGSFFSKTFKSKVGRNPKTGEVLVLPPGRKTIRFRASKILLKRLNKNFTENNISDTY